MLVFTNGCFDVLHPGHLAVIKRCRQLAGPSGVVIVGLNSDESVRRLKGEGRPFFHERERMDMLLAFRDVSNVVLFREDTPEQLIKSLKPDVIVKGGDYEPKDVVGFGMAAIDIVSYDDRYSTTRILEWLKKN